MTVDLERSIVSWLARMDVIDASSGPELGWEEAQVEGPSALDL